MAIPYDPVYVSLTFFKLETTGTTWKQSGVEGFFGFRLFLTVWVFRSAEFKCSPEPTVRCSLFVIIAALMECCCAKYQSLDFISIDVNRLVDQKPFMPDVPRLLRYNSLKCFYPQLPQWLLDERACVQSLDMCRWINSWRVAEKKHPRAQRASPLQIFWCSWFFKVQKSNIFTRGCWLIIHSWLSFIILKLVISVLTKWATTCSFNQQSSYSYHGL